MNEENLIRKLSKKEIKAFCGPCDFLGDDCKCKRSLVESGEAQKRRVKRGICAFAAVKKEEGTLRTDGFFPKVSSRMAGGV